MRKVAIVFMGAILLLGGTFAYAVKSTNRTFSPAFAFEVLRQCMPRMARLCHYKGSATFASVANSNFEAAPIRQFEAGDESSFTFRTADRRHCARVEFARHGIVGYDQVVEFYVCDEERSIHLGTG
jgi:hypothetical protein